MFFVIIFPKNTLPRNKIVECIYTHSQKKRSKANLHTQTQVPFTNCP